MIGFILIILGAALAAWPFAAEWWRRPAPKKTPATRIGEARTHYRWMGPESGPVAVCIHGLTTPSQAFDPLAGALVGQGFRVLLYDLPGRGGSEPGLPPQDRRFFLRQLEGLLAETGTEEIDLLVGYSMGGAIATCYAADNPDRVERLVLLAPAGFVHEPGRLGRLARDIPVLGDWLMIGPGGWLTRRALRRAAPGQAPASVTTLQIAQTRQRGYLPSVLSSLRHMLTLYLGDDHKRLASLGVPVQAIWGGEDRVIPASNMGRLAELNRDARQDVIESATHALPFTHAGQVAALIRDFVKTG